tara:strand:+ start:219 stop:704 length:486 start_codon:yes stop_codon:yes gene_type:complete
MKKSIVIFLYFILLTHVNAEEIISGKAKVINSDYIKINDQIIILYGIEAMERKQVCYIDGKIWPCYEITVRFLESLVDLGETTCRVIKKSRMGRVFGVCEVINIEINKELVEKGFALARRKQTKDYVKYEKIAKKNELGIWQSEFIKPWDWRKRYNVPSDP